jgi:hypothetical protein
LTAAITGRGISPILSYAARNRFPTSRASAGPPNSLMSAPAANALAPPNTTTAFTSSSSTS